MNHNEGLQPRHTGGGLRFILMALLWGLVILGGYYYFHKPFTPNDLFTPLSSLLDLITACLIILICGGLGNRFFNLSDISAPLRSILHAALGIGLASLIWLGLGLAHLYTAIISWLILVISLFWLRASIQHWLKDLNGIISELKNSDTLTRLFAIITGLFALSQLLFALAPPTRWDALTYHLELPRQYLLKGGLEFLPQNLYWGHPQLAEMLYTWAMSLHRAQTAAVLGWMVSCLALVGMIALTRFTGLSNQSAWAAAAAVLSGLTFRNVLGAAYTDQFAVLMGLAVLSFCLIYLQKPAIRWLALAGLLIGMAGSVKWSSGLILILPAVTIFLSNQHSLADKLRRLTITGLFALIPTAPWLLKNVFFAGNPLYPYGIPTAWVSAVRLMQANRPEGVLTFWQYALFPLSSTWMGVDAAAGFATDIGPLLILFALPALWLNRKSPSTWVLLAGLIAVWGAVTVGGLRTNHLQQTRLYFVMLPCLALAFARGWNAAQPFEAGGVRLRRLAQAALLLVLALSGWQDMLQQARLNPLGAVLGTTPQQTYLEQSTGWYAVATRSLNRLPADSSTLMLWEPRAFYAPPSVQADPWIDMWRTTWAENLSIDAVLSNWQDQGYTHLLVYRNGLAFTRSEPGADPAGYQALEQILRACSVQEDFDGVYTLYRLP